MDSLTTAAARALAAGDPLGALKRVALREDPAALALRGIAMAQLGDLGRARTLVRRAARAFGQREPVARARCVVAEAEIALVSRDLTWPAKSLDSARLTLEQHGDHRNAVQARHLDARRHLLVGRLDEAERALATLDEATLSPASTAVHELVTAGIAMRRLRSTMARMALDRAHRAARSARIPALEAEVDVAMRTLATPAARLVTGDTERSVRLAEIESLMSSGSLVVDACRHVVREARRVTPLVTRPVLFALVRKLAEAWPGDVSRDTLVARAFGGRTVDESHRVRLRVEIARLRRAIRQHADVRATRRGFMLVPARASGVVVLTWPIEEEHAEVLACVSDGESWSSSALALALGTSQRTVQRALDVLSSRGRVQSFGRGRARRWVTVPMPGFATTLLLPAPLPTD